MSPPSESPSQQSRQGVLLAETHSSWLVGVLAKTVQSYDFVQMFFLTQYVLQVRWIKAKKRDRLLVEFKGIRELLACNNLE